MCRQHYNSIIILINAVKLKGRLIRLIREPSLKSSFFFFSIQQQFEYDLPETKEDFLQGSLRQTWDVGHTEPWCLFKTKNSVDEPMMNKTMENSLNEMSKVGEEQMIRGLISMLILGFCFFLK